MTQDDPFAEATDTDKTVIRLNPGGRRPEPAPLPPQTAPVQHVETSTAPVVTTPNPQAALTPDVVAGFNALCAAASPLFQLVGRIRNRAQHADAAQLRESVVSEIRAFETRASVAGVPGQIVKVARYAICATVDDVVLNTPWGGNSIWAQQSMVGTFHKETHGGERFYDLLDRLQADPGSNRDLLEFLYMCLSLGFEGRLRVASRGVEKHLAVRDGLARTIRAQRGRAEPDLSPHWQGLKVAHRVLSIWMPVWLLAGLTTALTALAFFVLSFLLSLDTERVRGQILALDLGGPITLARPAPPPPPAPLPPPEQVNDLDRISTFLAPEIAQELVTVTREGNTVLVRINGQGMFGSGSDVLREDIGPLIDRVAAALEPETGRIIVAGHSDNVPISTARFPSNLALSLARAESVMDKIVTTLSDPNRITAEGRADNEPIATNDTPDGRAQNRRIDVILIEAG
ncbi:type VI secretion system protein TssL, long form [uncultured Tateyamaria sp.]|uniref:type VI secretion system protein TssL, long form n=1 Tax=uncultured Tateyamaria sp. TaxID=455651 RepID=UPI0026204B5D|nr:type VI secretion system protein TssL, long form [uncultured Tateyamaria sp.]